MSSSSSFSSFSSLYSMRNLSRSRHDYSGELEVFDAAQYYSAGHEYHSICSFQKPKSPPRSRLDCFLPLDTPKTPSSPRARLTGFLNSLFIQSQIKNKKQKKATAKSSSSGGFFGASRKRRVSTSFLPSDINTKSFQEFGFRTENYKEDKVQIHEQRGDYQRKEESNTFKHKVSDKKEEYDENRHFFWDSRKLNNDDDDTGSDSSSDLFDLPSHYFFAQGHPIYRTKTV